MSNVVDVNVSIPLFSSIVYFFFLVITLIFGSFKKWKWAFCIYLFSLMMWGFFAYLIRLRIFNESALFIHKFIVGAGFFVPVSFFIFASIFSNRPSPILNIFCIILLISILVLDSFNLIVIRSEVNGYLLYYEMSPLYYIFYVCALFVTGMGLYKLIVQYRFSKDKLERKQIISLIAGTSFIIIFSIIFNLFDSSVSKYSFDHIGSILNAFVIIYISIKFKFFSFNLPFRQFANNDNN